MSIRRQSASFLLAPLILTALSALQVQAATIVVNNTAEDTTTQIGGITQTEPSSAWCGNTVVTAFTDSGSPFQTANKGLPYSNIGFANSINAGASFTDRGAAPGLTGFITLGPPSVACGSAANADMVAPGFQSSTHDQSLMFWQSFNDGQSFGTPRVLVSEAPQVRILNLVETINPANPLDRNLTWMTSDESLKVCKTGTGTVVSTMFTTNGGATWSPPVKVDSRCGSSLANQQLLGPSPAWLTSGKVGVVYGVTNSAQTGFTLEFKAGTVAGFPLTANIVSPTIYPIGGDFGVLPASSSSPPSTGLGFLGGNIYEPPAPKIAVDNSPFSPFRGRTYIVWSAGNQTVSDAFGPGGLYHFDNIVWFNESANGGITWSTPIKINDDSVTAHTDHFGPRLATDAKGNIIVGFYDRRKDPANRESNVFSALSTNGGTSFGPNFQQSTAGSSIGFYPLGDIQNSVPFTGDAVSVNTDFVRVYTTGSLFTFTSATGEKDNVVGALVACCQLPTKCSNLSHLAADSGACEVAGGTTKTGSCNTATGKCQ